MDVVAWLQGLGLERYEQAFRENRIETDILPSLTVEDLKDLGVTLVGDRRRLLDAIAALGAAQTRLTAAGERSAAAATGARWEEQLLDAGYDEISVQQSAYDEAADTRDLDQWDVWVPTYPGSNDAIYWDQLTTEELGAIHRRGQITVWNRERGDYWQPAHLLSRLATEGRGFHDSPQ